MVKYKRTKEEIEDAVKSSFSLAEVLRKLDIIPAGGNYATLKRNIVLFDVDISHFTGQAHNLGKFFVDAPRTNKSIKERLFVSRGRLCEECKNDTWNGQPIPLELEHIDGNNTNQVEENWLLLCPNCHAQTSTYRRSKSSLLNPKDVCSCGNKKQHESKKCLECYRLDQNKKKEQRTFLLDGDLRKRNNVQQNICSCGKPITRESRYCKSCVPKETKIIWPSNDELIERLKTSNYTKLGKELGVSDNAIRKRLNRG